jgi:hypothetical protein
MPVGQPKVVARLPEGAYGTAMTSARSNRHGVNNSQRPDGTVAWIIIVPEMLEACCGGCPECSSPLGVETVVSVGNHNTMSQRASRISISRST